MSGPGVDALSAVLCGVSALLLFASAVYWSKLARDRGQDRRAISVHALRSAAALTAVTFLTLGIAACWFAFTTIPWS
jgi:hypothetical protein